MAEIESNFSRSPNTTMKSNAPKSMWFKDRVRYRNIWLLLDDFNEQFANVLFSRLSHIGSPAFALDVHVFVSRPKQKLLERFVIYIIANLLLRPLRLWQVGNLEWSFWVWSECLRGLWFISLFSEIKEVLLVNWLNWRLITWLSLHLPLKTSMSSEWTVYVLISNFTYTICNVTVSPFRNAYKRLDSPSQGILTITTQTRK